MAVERERSSDAEPFHDGKTGRIGVGIGLVCMSRDDGTSLLFVGSSNGLNAPSVSKQPASGDVWAEFSEQKRVRFRDDEIRQESVNGGATASGKTEVCIFVMSVRTVQNREHRAGIYEDERHDSISPSAR